ncbi:MAG: hypothetical protein HY350_04315 [Candidatus Omnitrophica bacterium]|nr:hypothetical protein [Candidatus Omnitrophota bacterium]
MYSKDLIANDSLQAYSLEFKPDIKEAAKRWDAFHAGGIIDRPVVCVVTPREGCPATRGASYREKVQGDMDKIVGKAIDMASATFYGGEAMPVFDISFGPDEIAVFCGAEMAWSDSSPDTNWSVPCVKDWEEALPLMLRDGNPLWQRMLRFYGKAAERMAGKMLITPPDLHTNMDLLAAMRGTEKLCMDLVDKPEIIDRAMAGARAVFPLLWDLVSRAGRMGESGYCQGVYARDGAAMLQCDFSCMVSPEMFRRWILPALEEEAQIVKHFFYHLDGPNALIHLEDLLSLKWLHTISYVPCGGGHIDHIDLFKHIQAKGKAVQVWGMPEQIKYIHSQIDPAKVCYFTNTNSEHEARELLAWFTKNT